MQHTHRPPDSARTRRGIRRRPIVPLLWRGPRLLQRERRRVRSGRFRADPLLRHRRAAVLQRQREQHRHDRLHEREPRQLVLDGRNDEPDDDGSGGGDNDAFATPGDVPTSNGGTLGVASAAAAPALDAVPLAVLRKPGGGGEAVSVTVEGVEDDVVGLQYPVATAEQRTPCGPIQNRWPSTVQPATSNS